MPKKDKDRECTCTEKRGKLFTCDYCKDEEVQDYDDLFEDDDPQKDKEKRKDTDGKMYTRKQFIKMYKECDIVCCFMLNGLCTLQSCPKMKAATHNYLWEDEPGVK